MDEDGSEGKSKGKDAEDYIVIRFDNNHVLTVLMITAEGRELLRRLFDEKMPKELNVRTVNRSY